MAPTCSDGVRIIAVITGSSIFSIRPGIRQLRRAVDLLHHAVGGRHPVEHARRGRDQVHVELALEPLLDDLHVQQAEEAAAEAEAERRRRLRLEEERRVVQPQLLERVAQLRVLAAFDRIEPGEDHRLADLEARETARRVGRAASVMVSPICASLTVLMPATMKPTSPTPSSLDRDRLGREHADLLDLVLLPLRHQPDLHARPDHAVDARGSG